MEDSTIQRIQVFNEGIRIENILLNFYLATGLETILADKNGIITMKNNLCSFCKMITCIENGQQICEKTYADAAILATSLNQPFIFKCHIGLGAFAIPLKDKDSCSTVVCRKIVVYDNLLFDEGLDYLLKEAERLRVMSTQEVTAAANVLYSLIQNNRVLDDTYTEKLKVETVYLAANNEWQVKVRNFHEVVEKHKNDDFYSRYRALIVAIKIGDKNGVLKLLSQALDLITEKFADSPHEFKTRIMEYALKISRDVAEFGVDLDELTSIDSKFVDEVYETNDNAQLRMCINKVVISYVEFVADKTKKYKYDYIVQHAIEYIKDNYEKNLSLESIANAIHVSSYYLCHTFKQFMNCSIKQYIIRVKIGRVQALLLNLNLSIDEICVMVGYQNNRHFVETFKKLHGVTPHQYRAKLLNS